MFRSLHEGSLIESGIFPCVLALSFELVSGISAFVGISIIKNLKTFTVFVAIIKLALVICVFFLVVNKFSESIPLAKFIVTKINLAIGGDGLAISIHESIEEGSRVNERVFVVKLNKAIAVFFVSKEVSLINVFGVSDLDAVALPGDLFHWSLGHVLPDVNGMVEVADEDEVLDGFEVVYDMLLVFVVFQVVL
jgi:hypothetical protein